MSANDRDRSRGFFKRKLVALAERPPKRLVSYYSAADKKNYPAPRLLKEK
jgi:hypothetical protein